MGSAGHNAKAWCALAQSPSPRLSVGVMPPGIPPGVGTRGDTHPVFLWGQRMKIGVPKETAANERRVALTPDVAGRLVKSGLTVLVERGAGEAASLGDEIGR